MTLLSILIVIVITVALLFDFVNGWNDSANAPDALPNYFLRAAPTVIAGVNTANLPELSISKPPVILPGVAMIALSRDLPTSAAHQWNLTLEGEIMKDTGAQDISSTREPVGDYHP